MDGLCLKNTFYIEDTLWIESKWCVRNYMYMSLFDDLKSYQGHRFAHGQNHWHKPSRVSREASVCIGKMYHWKLQWDLQPSSIKHDILNIYFLSRLIQKHWTSASCTVPVWPQGVCTPELRVPSLPLPKNQVHCINWHEEEREKCLLGKMIGNYSSESWPHQFN